ncbi:MAG TPA: SGNH hydrolase domain-containing protein, partial [Microbacteriaceae bacterium]|nr:SGNH hydrolase domain-containing protein [Microbacteriaceae bacterium]
NVVRVMPPCLGAASITGPERHTCEADPHADPLSGTASPGAAVPSPAAVHEDIPKTCQASPTSSRLNVCSVGVPASSAVRTVALVGDSHAAEWEPALERVANREGWHVVMLLKGSCAFNTSQRRAGSGSREARSCAAWNRKAAVKLQQIPGLDLVIVSADIKDLYRASEGASGYENAVSGYVAAWRGLPSTVQVDVIADTPRPVPNVVDCLALHRGQAAAATACARPRTAALGDDPLVSAAEELPARVRLVTMTDDFCSATTCDPIIGHVTVYRDQSHISATYSATLAPALRRALAEADKPPRNSTGMGG